MPDSKVLVAPKHFDDNVSSIDLVEFRLESTELVLLDQILQLLHGNRCDLLGILNGNLFIITKEGSLVQCIVELHMVQQCQTIRTLQLFQDHRLIQCCILVPVLVDKELGTISPQCIRLIASIVPVQILCIRSISIFVLHTTDLRKFGFHLTEESFPFLGITCFLHPLLGCFQFLLGFPFLAGFFLFFLCFMGITYGIDPILLEDFAFLFRRGHRMIIVGSLIFFGMRSFREVDVDAHVEHWEFVLGESCILLETEAFVETNRVIVRLLYGQLVDLVLFQDILQNLRADAMIPVLLVDFEVVQERFVRVDCTDRDIGNLCDAIIERQIMRCAVYGIIRVFRLLPVDIQLHTMYKDVPDVFIVVRSGAVSGFINGHIGSILPLSITLVGFFDELSVIGQPILGGVRIGKQDLTQHLVFRCGFQSQLNGRFLFAGHVMIRPVVDLLRIFRGIVRVFTIATVVPISRTIIYLNGTVEKCNNRFCCPDFSSQFSIRYIRNKRQLKLVGIAHVHVEDLIFQRRKIEPVQRPHGTIDRLVQRNSYGISRNNFLEQCRTENVLRFGGTNDLVVQAVVGTDVVVPGAFISNSGVFIHWSQDKFRG